MKSKPVIYLLYGEDELAIAERVTEFVARMGDSPAAQMNISRLDGRSTSFDELMTAVSAMPFLTERRLVVLTHPLAYGSNVAMREKFKGLLDKIPPTTALILVENGPLTDEVERRKGKINWLEEWAQNAGERVSLKYHGLPQGAAFTQWIQKRARESGGQFTPQAAERLVTLIGDDILLADQEIRKLLIYVNFGRAVEAEDVELLTASVREGNIFTLVDAVGERKGREAMGMLRQLLVEQEPFQIWAMIIRQFRLLLQAREILDEGGNEGEVSRQLKLYYRAVEKITSQSRRFTQSALEAIYRRLLMVDEMIKSGEIEVETALETFVAGLTL